MESKKTAEYKLQDLIDIPHFQILQDRLNQIYSFPSAIIDNEGNILTATAWQDICTKFHRKNAECEKECVKSDQYIISHLHEANPAVSYRCPYGLVDNATPIIIDGIHYGNFFTGQFFLEKPDIDFFRSQAKRYIFDESAYIEAVRKVPIWTKEQLEHYLYFIKGLISIISESGLKNLREIEARREIEESELRSRTILSQIHDGFWAVTPEGKIVDVNDVLCSMTGYSREELLAMTISEVIAHDSPQKIEERIDQIIKSQSSQFESVFRRKNGVLVDVEVSISYLRDQNLLYCFNHDITERKNTEKKLAEKTRFSQTLVDLNPDVIYIYDIVKRSNVFSNNGVQRVLGYSIDELQTMGDQIIPMLMHPDDFKTYIESTIVQYQTAKDGELIHHQYRMKHKNGQWRWLESTETIYLRNQDCSPREIFGVIHDITEIRKATDALMKTQKLEGLGILAGGIAHDFNNLLGGIFGLIDLASETTQERQVAQYLTKALSTIDRARALTGQLLTFAKGGSPIKILDSITPFIEETVKFALSGSNVLCTFDIEKDTWLCEFDKNQIGQVIDNIVINAQQAMPEGGMIEIHAGNHQVTALSNTTLATGSYIKIAIRDHGIGMPGDILPKIFDPFFTTKAKGHGLGLATCYSIVKKHGGCIEVVSESGKGSTFMFYLPAAPNASLSRHTDTIVNHSGNGQVLIMDDEEVIRETLGTMLETMRYKVTFAVNSEEAINAFKTAKMSNTEFEAIFLDLTIPGGPGGKDTIREIRKIDKNVVSFVVSGYADDPVMANPTGFGFNDSICKPFRKSEIAGLLNRYVKK